MEKVVEFCGELKWETDNAYLIFDGVNDVWIPKSQVKRSRQLSKGGRDWEFIIPHWLATEKGIV